MYSSYCKKIQNLTVKIKIFFRISGNESIIQLMMDRLPEERLKRTVVRGRIDVLGKNYK